MGAARVTVVIPCYNDAATVGETVDSVREAEPVEIIVVDDGSRDEATIALLDRLAASGRIQLVRKANGGVASALRAGFESAQTPYVFVIASDDLVDAGAIGELADALEREPEYDFAYGHSHHFGAVDFVRRAAPWNPWILLHSNLWEAACLYRRDASKRRRGVPRRQRLRGLGAVHGPGRARQRRAVGRSPRLPLSDPLRGRTCQPGRQDALSRALRDPSAQSSRSLRARARTRVALPASVVVAAALPAPAREWRCTSRRASSGRCSRSRRACAR